MSGLKSVWRKFRSLRTRWQVLSWVGVAFVVLLIIGAVSPSEEKKSTEASGDSGDQAASAKDENPTATPKPEKATNTPKPTSTPKPPTVTPEPLTFEQQAEKSYKDNKGFMPRTNTDGMQVSWAPTDGILSIDLYPKFVLSDGDNLTIASHSALVASRAVWTTYPDVKRLRVAIWGDFVNQSTGASSSSIVAAIEVTRPTGEKFVYDGLQSVALGDNKRFFCGADNYQIHPSTYASLGDKGCLATWGFRK